MIAKRNPSILNLGIGFLLVMVGEIVGRGVFYGLHMTVGMAVN
ncbi:DMSO reductase anchor subunit [Providencia rustigianii]|nr:DMSO reductase anchor subunit [Providencia rustigianii]